MAKAQTITILNWEKYQPRGDVKFSSWYRKEHRIHFDPDWAHFTGQELHVWDHLLALASVRNGASFNYLPEKFAQTARVPLEVFASAIKKLEVLECVTLSDARSDVVQDLNPKQVCNTREDRVLARNQVRVAIRNGSLKKPKKCTECGAKARIECFHEDYSKPLDIKWLCTKCHHKRRLNGSASRTEHAHDTDAEHKESVRDEYVYIRDETGRDNKNGASDTDTRSFASNFDFESLYKQFPRRGSGKDMRKADGMKKCRAQIKSEKKYQDLTRAVENYAQYVADEKRKDSTWCYNVQWGTFMSANYWVDWVNPEDDSQKKRKPILIGSDECSHKNDSIL